MTELQWLIKTLTEEKLSQKLKDLFIQRLGEVEFQLSSQRPQPQPRPVVIPTNTDQALSMQRIIDAQGIPAIGNVTQSPIIPKPTVAVDKETGRAMVATGKGTFGPRKF